MAYTDINSEDRLVQKTFAEHLERTLGWESLVAWNQESFGPDGTLGRASEREVVLVRDLRAALAKFNPALPTAAIQDAVVKLSVAAEVLLNGMLAKDRLLDIVENFILFDASKPGAVRKVVARNHQLLGVNQAVAAVVRQEEIKRQFPPPESQCPRSRSATSRQN